MSDPFPYSYTSEANVPRYLQVTAEGKPLGEALWTGVAYLRKYRRAKWSAPVEEMAHFDIQRRLVRRLAATTATGPRLGVVGDLMWIRDGWDTFVSPEVLAYLAGHAAVIGNLESPISSRFPVPSRWPDYFTYNSAPGLVTSFQRPDGTNLFSALATANNHSLDRGDEGLADTLAFLDKQKIPRSGVTRPGDPPFVLFSAGDIRLGMYATCWGLNNPAAVASSKHHIEVQPGLAPRIAYPVDLTRIGKALAEMAAGGAEFRIVSLHAGHEFEFYPRPEFMRIARDIVRLGADLIVGHHPHVVQPMEVLSVNGYDLGSDLPPSCRLGDETGIPRKALVAYSLGNFATAMFTLHCRTGLILSLHLEREDRTGRVDWHYPQTRLVFNAFREPGTRQRRLMLLESYLRLAERQGDRCFDLRRLVAWLEGHLMGKASRPGLEPR